MPSTEADPPAGDFSLTAPVWSGTPAAARASDAALLAALLRAEVALASAWAAQGAVTAQDARAVAEAADGTRYDVRRIALEARGGGNPVIPLVTELRSRAGRIRGEAAAAVHKTATSQDILDTAYMLVASDVRAVVLEDVRRAADACARLAAEHRSTLMAARTLTQHGVPTTFGLKAAGWLAGIDDAAAALGAVPLQAQLGGASGTLAATVAVAGVDGAERLVRDFAAELGLAAPRTPWHVHRGTVTRLGDALASVCDALGKIALDVTTLSRPELAELAEPRAAGRGGSSAMPQKRNPVLAVLVHAAARQASGLAAELHRSALAVDERPDGAWHAEWTALRELLRLTGGAAALSAELLSGLEVFPERMRANLDADAGLELSERLVAELGDELGVSRVRSMVADAVAGAPLREILAEALGDESRVEGLLDPAGYLGLAETFVTRVLDAHEGGRHD